MDTLKYTIIKNKKQYKNYCDILENLIILDDKTLQDEIDLITLLIDKWDNENSTLNKLNPIELLEYLMTEHNLKAKDLTEVLGLSKGTVSKILSYNKGLSKETIRKLSNYFKVSQEAFNRPYKLKNEINTRYKNAKLMNTKKKMATA